MFCYYPRPDLDDSSHSFEHHPEGVEPGDWYSLAPVSIEGEMIGKEMLDWLEITESNFTHYYHKLLRIKSTLKASVSPL
jgi:hypothetical protein